MEETQTFVFICKPEESAKVNTKEKVGEKEHSGHENQAEALAGYGERFHLEQEKLLALDEEQS